ncbi:MAG: hypothetical protein KatS3mg031_1459 [Chitinophagales bacterium]|nr:MAG: hypothetical protein KatS3mg031_1459 [Chitinophagales bacterium]
MAVIMKIRDRFGIVIVVVIALAIAGFLIQDALSSNSSLLNFGSQNAGVINGTEISIQDYDRKVQEAIENYRSTSNQATMDDQTIWSIREQIWAQYINDIVMGDKYSKLGLRVTPEELYDMIQGPEPHPAIIQSFTNPETGQYDPGQVALFLQQLDNDETGNTRRRWLNFEKFLKEERTAAKFNNLVKKAIYTPTWMAKENYTLTATTVDFAYVYLPYTDVADAEVQVSDSELKKLYEKNKSKYKQEESRTIEYVAFPIQATREDTLRIKAKLEELIPAFQTAKSDSAFMKLYSDEPFDARYYGKEELQSSMRDTFFSIDTNTVIGPYLEEGAWVIAKLIDRKLIPDSVKARHIFLSIAEAKSQNDVNFKRTQADSLMKVLQDKQADFNSLVLQYSDDEATKFKGGDWGWIKPGEKFLPIDYALFYAHRQGDIFMIPADEPGNAGFHIIEITEAKPVKDAVQVAFLKKHIIPGSETERAAYTAASKFAASHKTAKAFKEAAGEYTLQQAENIRKNDYTIPGLGTSRELVKWVYSAEINEVSDVFSLEDKYVIALLSKIKEEGYVPFEEVRPELEAQLKKEKKAEMLKTKIKNHTDLPSLAASLGIQVDTAYGMTFSSTYIDPIGQEPAVVSKALTLTPDDGIVAVAGERGVFAIQLVNKNTPPEAEDYGRQKAMMTRQVASRVEGALAEAIRKAAEIKDQRYKFY